MMGLAPIGPTPWKILYKSNDRRREPARTYACALAREGERCTPLDLRAANIMVWDHCHKHGYIRGPLCAQHNLRMHQFDSGQQRCREKLAYVKYARRCPDCLPLQTEE